MPRKRDISPDLWGSEQFLSLATDAQRLSFIAAGTVNLSGRVSRI